MINTIILIDEAEVKKRLGYLESKSNKVIARAVNRSYTSGKKAISKEAKKIYLVNDRDVNGSDTLKITKATYQAPMAKLLYTGYHRNLYHYRRAVSPRRIIKWSNGRPNVAFYKAHFMGEHAPEPLTKDPKPFVQKMKRTNGVVGLFRRSSNKRDASLVGVPAPAIPQILKNERIMSAFTRSAGPMLQKRLEHEIDNVLKGVTK